MPHRPTFERSEDLRGRVPFDPLEYITDFELPDTYKLTMKGVDRSELRSTNQPTAGERSGRPSAARDMRGHFWARPTGDRPIPDIPIDGK